MAFSQQVSSSHFFFFLGLGLRSISLLSFNFTVFRFHINVFCHLLLSANLDLNGMYPHGQSVYFVVVRNRFFSF